MLEPIRRDSGPAIAAGAAFAAKRECDPLAVALAADHVITDPAAFAKVCRFAADGAAADRIVTFGVRLTRPATEYGYIRAGDIDKFAEKPDLALRPRRLSVELRQFHISRRIASRRIPEVRTGQPRQGRGVRRARQRRSRFRRT
jgi:hypothetical protein